MNSLSWFIYGAEVVGNIKAYSLPFMIVGFIVALVLSFCGVFMHAIEWSWTTDKQRKFWEDKRLSCAKAAKWVWPALIASVLIGSFIPSQNTLYAIAASQIGEQVIKSETVQDMTSDATKALQQWIKRQIADEKK